MTASQRETPTAPVREFCSAAHITHLYKQTRDSSFTLTARSHPRPSHFQKITFIKVTSPHLCWMNLCTRGRLDYICDGEIVCWRACYKTQEWDDLHATCEASDKPLKSEMDGLLNMNHLELSQRTADERSVSVWSTHLNFLWWYWFDISVLHIKSPQIYNAGNSWTM